MAKYYVESLDLRDCLIGSNRVEVGCRALKLFLTEKRSKRSRLGDFVVINERGHTAEIVHSEMSPEQEEQLRVRTVVVDALEHIKEGTPNDILMIPTHLLLAEIGYEIASEEEEEGHY